MATVILVRHGRTRANATGLLAGRTPGVGLDETGATQVERAARRLSGLPLASIVTSPLQRCQETARALVADRPDVELLEDESLTECDYGDWQGRALAELAKESLWGRVQAQPSAVTFPGGESMRAMQARGVDAVRRHDERVAAEHGERAVWVAVSHGDVIKAIVAEAMGTHLDHFQRVRVDPASLSIITYAESRPYVLGVNTHEGGLDWLAVPEPTPVDAVVGGGAGPAAPAGS